MVILLASVLGTLAFAALVYVFLLMPRGRRESSVPFMRVSYAHRGLHGKDGVPENSLTAFRLAVEAGYGIELDVQLSADGEVMVFHDESLSRMTGVDAPLCSYTRESLASLRLAETQEKIPTLAEVLSLVDGRVPLLVEIKKQPALSEACARTAALLDAYRGPYMIESFHPMAVNWFRKHRPEVVRGQLSSRLFQKGARSFSHFLVQNLLLNFLCRPDFIAYDYKGKTLLSFRLCRALYRPYTVAWTVRDGEGLKAARGFDAVIFESLSAEELAAEGRREVDK